jgi:uncharacterized protein YbjQ (UPF0145 family)
MSVTTGLSGNEIFCLQKKGYAPGNIVVGNSVHSLGFLGSVGSGFKAMLGGELQQITQLIEDGRETAYGRMFQEAETHGATGITGVTSELILHGSNIEFLSIGSSVHAVDKNEPLKFSTAADGQELYAQLDVGYEPICFAFGNTAYSMGLGRGILGGLKTLGRGEIKEYSDIFNHTRHLSLQRIIAHAQKVGADAVLGIRTSIIPFSGINEMLMIGTASRSNHLTTSEPKEIVTSDMTNIEMWNMASMGYAPMRLLLGTSVYSLGLVGGVTASLKSFVRGEINELTQLIYSARENALAIINDEAKSIGADDVVGVAIGTAVKKLPGIKTESAQLPPQAIVVDKDTFYDATYPGNFSLNMNQGAKPINRKPILRLMFIVVMIILLQIFTPHH